MDMHGRIMNLTAKPPKHWDVKAWVDALKVGHKQARHAAAEIASEGDALIAEMLAALERVCREFPTDSDLIEAGWLASEIDASCEAHSEAVRVTHKARAFGVRS